MENKDRFKSKLHEIKELVSGGLTDDEKEEVDIFIDRISEDLQNKMKKIDYKKLTESVKKLLKENKDV